MSYASGKASTTSSRVELGPLQTDGLAGFGYASGGGGGDVEAKGMGDVQMDAGIPELRFVSSPLDGDKTSDEVDVRVPYGLGPGGQAAGCSRQRSSSPLVPTDAVFGEGAVVLSSEISLATLAPGR